MQRSEISAPSPSMIQYEVTSALPTSSKRRRLVSEVWNDFNKVEVGGKVEVSIRVKKKWDNALEKSLVKMFGYKKWRIM